MRLNFPRDIRSVHQIEISSRCNLRCRYCTSPDIVDGKYPNRVATDMTRQCFERALEWVRFYARQGQNELNLAGIGESTLHPDFVDFFRLARESIPHGKLVFATNGIIHDEAMIKAIAPYNPRVYVSLHRPEKAALAMVVYKKYGLLEGTSSDPATQPNDWAGQIEWPIDRIPFPCPWMQRGRVFVMADGRISSCCLDAQGIGVIGHVNDTIGSLQTKPYKLCQSCYQEIGAENWDQLAGMERR